MYNTQPIYTEKTECQDCYKCVRACPVKAIKVIDGSAAVIPEACILCGRCTEVCPVGAKKIRDDLAAARALIGMGSPVYASLAPSFRTEFSGLSCAKLINAIKTLGFAGVSETALGAQEVSSACASLLKSTHQKFHISSACPSAIHLIEQYYPHLTKYVTPLLSPLQAHTKMLKRLYGQNIKIVFIGPCVAKKNETKDHFDYALTFSDLRRWFTQAEVDWTHLNTPAEFVPYPAGNGGLYPIDGGMLEGIKHYDPSLDVHFMSFSGVEAIMDAFTDLDRVDYGKHVFVELLSCSGGCVNGPAVITKGSTVKKRYSIIDNTPLCIDPVCFNPDEIRSSFASRAIVPAHHNPSDIAAALLKISKKRREDELNCGGCGYNTCREFAAALLENKAEAPMCVSYLRKLAQNKAAALIKAMPSGLVIVDENLKIFESNRHFIEIIGGDADIVSQADPDLEGAYLERLIPFHEHFSKVLKEGTEVMVTDVRYNKKIIRVTVFSIQAHHVVGGIFQDITEPVIQREQIIEKAAEVMKKNLTTVQQIAFLLGENAADSEILLNSIIESFTVKE